MKLSKIYANKPFKNIEFNEGLNVILGKMSDRDNRGLDSHGLGKSLLLEVIDFLLLKKVKSKDKYFLTNKEWLSEYIFYAELKLNSGKYLIIKRAVNPNTRIAFKLSRTKIKGFDTDIQDWDYPDIGIDKAITLLNEYLNFSILKDWKYRKMINYFMRYQNDYTDVFKLSKFQGVHKDWKPMVFELLGFNGSIFYAKLELEEQYKKEKERLDALESENQITSEDEDKVRGLIEIKSNEYESLSNEIDRFNFYTKDNEAKDKLVNEIEEQIKDANSEHYTLKYEIDKIEKSLENELDTIDIQEIKELYDEVEIMFPSELLIEYDKLVTFNKEITEERNLFLVENLKELKNQELGIENTLKKLEEEKSLLFIDITEKTTYEKFKKYQKDLSRTQADIYILENKLTSINKMSKLQADLNTLTTEINKKIALLKKEILKQSHKNIRKFFNEFTMKTLNTPAILSVKINKNNNIEFEAQYQNEKELIATDKAKGTTYKKILCSAFDTSLLRFYNQKSFYRFVYHDGILDSLDIRIKENYIEYIRTLVKEYDIQYIITAIESEINTLANEYEIKREDVCLTLSDESDEELLFKKSF